MHHQEGGDLGSFMSPDGFHTVEFRRLLERLASAGIALWISEHEPEFQPEFQQIHFNE